MISSVTKQPLINDNTKHNYIVVYSGGKEWTVPHDTANKDYQEILEWVANGGTIVDNGA